MLLCQRSFIAFFLSAGVLFGGVFASSFAYAGEKKDDEKKKEAKKDDEKKVEPKKDDKSATHVELKNRLKKYDADIARIRADMLKEIEAEEKKIDDAIAKLKKDHADANKAQDYKTAVKISVAMSNLRVEKMRVGMIRGEVERKLPAPLVPPPPRVVPADERLGFHTSPVSSVVAAQLGLPKDQGLVIDRVDPQSPADKAGLKKYDILVKVDGKAVSGSGTALRKLLADLKAEAAFEATVLRQGKEVTIKELIIPKAAN